MKDKALEIADNLLRENTQLTVEAAYLIRDLIKELYEQEVHTFSEWTRIHNMYNKTSKK
jgi:hypothetical protein